MISARINFGARRNPAVQAQRRKRGEGNAAWIGRAVESLKVRQAVILLGGSDLIHFRLRVAQSQTRSDLLPSFWSHAALFNADVAAARRLIHVPPVPPLAGAAEVPRFNAITEAPLTAFDAADDFPNVAVLSFPTQEGSSPAAEAQKLKHARLAQDLVSPLVKWLGYVWGAAGSSNPLLDGHGAPSAVMLEAAFGACGVDLTPGVAERAVCPEAFWQAATWWREYYEPAPSKGRTSVAPAGRFVLDQEEAAVRQ